MNDAKPEEYKRLEKIGTVGLHIDFLRPGIGETFSCKGILNCAGSKIISISMELRNEKDVLIAIGGGSFIHR
jgi:acyl-coenzyme A thioesterase PaaI-like protein